MNPFRGLADLIFGSRKTDSAPEGGASDGPVPVLKDILQVLKEAKPPSEPREPLSQAAPTIQPSQPEKTGAAELLNGPPPAPAETAARGNFPAPSSEAGDRIRDKVKQAGEDADRINTGNVPPAPVVDVPPANVRVSPPVVNVPETKTEGGKIEPEREGLLGRFVERLKEIFGNLLSGLASLIGGMEKPGDQAKAIPVSDGGFGAGGPPPPTGANAPQPDKKANLFNKAKNTLGGFFHKKSKNVGRDAEAGLAGAGFGGAAKAAGVVGIVIGVGKALWDVGEKALHFALGLNEANRNIAMFSGQMAGAMAQLDMAEIQNNIKQAQATGGSGAALADEIRGLKNDFQPLRETIGTLKNTAAKLAVQILRPLADLANFASETLGIKAVAEEIEANTRNNRATEPTMQQMHDLASGEWMRQPEAMTNRQRPLEPL